MKQTDSYNNPIRFDVYPVQCVFDESSLILELEEQILSKIHYEDENVAGNLIFLLGKYASSAGSILVCIEELFPM